MNGIFLAEAAIPGVGGRLEFCRERAEFKCAHGIDEYKTVYCVPISPNPRREGRHPQSGEVPDGKYRQFDRLRSAKVWQVRILIPLLLVGLGSMLGGVSRYGMTLFTQNVSAFGLPYGTLASNLLGCLLVGLIAGFGGKTELLSTEMRLLLASGFCGGFTTMSSFIYELGQFVQDREYFFASSYFVATLAGAALAFALGLLLSASVLR